MTAIYEGSNRAMKRQIVKENLKIAKLVVSYLKSHPNSKDLLEKFPASHVSFYSTNSSCPSRKQIGSACAHCHSPWTNLEPTVNATCPVSRICIQQKFLAVPFAFSTLGAVHYSAPSPLRFGKIYATRIPIIMDNSLLNNKQNRYWKEGTGAPYTGTWAIVDVMCHELSHFITAIDDPKDNDSHGTKFYQNYLRLQQIMVTAVKTRDSSLPLELCTALWGHHD